MTLYVYRTFKVISVATRTTQADSRAKGAKTEPGKDAGRAAKGVHSKRA